MEDERSGCKRSREESFPEQEEQDGMDEKELERFILLANDL